MLGVGDFKADIPFVKSCQDMSSGLGNIGLTYRMNCNEDVSCQLESRSAAT
jgi:hypothetical protein